MAFAAYVICATPRSGSTLLCDLLMASGTGNPHSWFRREDVSYWAGCWGLPHAQGDPVFDRAYVAAMTQAGKGGTDLFGLRLMWDSVGEASRRLDAAFGGSADLAARIEQAFGPTLFIHLSRLDKAAQAASLVRAERTGLWHLHADGSERERIAPTRVDDQNVEQTRDDLTRADAAWTPFFHARGIEPLRLTYEALAADPQASLARVLTVLGRDAAVAARVSPRTAKIAGLES